MAKEPTQPLGLLLSEIEGVYHEIAVKAGLSDSELKILYTLHAKGNHCLLSDLSKLSGISRKTIHSAVKKLASQELLTLAPYDDKSKSVYLTGDGWQMARKLVEPMAKAENAILAGWSAAERDTFLRLLDAYREGLRAYAEG